MQTRIRQTNNSTRPGKALVLLALSLPMLFGLLGLVIDGSLLMSDARHLQTVTDAAATTAASEISNGGDLTSARQKAEALVHADNALPGATVTVNMPPTAGPYAGNANYLEVVITRTIPTHFMQVVSNQTSNVIRTRAVSGVEPVTAGAAFVILDEDPVPITISGLPAGLPSITLPSTNLAGLELLGLGQLEVDGAILVNNSWRGVDEHGDPVGSGTGIQRAVRCMPILPLTKLLARDLRVNGGVDDPNNYGNFVPGEGNPLQANRTPVPDPLINLPAPTLSSDPLNVSATNYGGVRIANLPLVGPPVTLQPGVYDWIEIISGEVTFSPGVYIVRGVNPGSGIAVSITGGTITADGVMFYTTNTTSYAPSDGLPDQNDGSTEPASGPMSMIPSVVINVGLTGSSFSGLNHSSSPFHGMFIYQRRQDRRPIVLVAEQLIGSASLSGTIYAKWGQLVFAGHGTYAIRFAVATARIVNATALSFNPPELFPPARDVSLVE